MPPEEPSGLVALWLELEGENLICRGERVFPTREQLRVTWYTATRAVPDGYIPIMNGSVFAYKDSVARVVQVDQFLPTRIGERFYWRDHASAVGLMIALVLPLGQTLAEWSPQLTEAKPFADRVAVFWLLYPQNENDSTVQVSWSLSESQYALGDEVERMNRAIFLSQKREEKSDYDIALSFAGGEHMWRKLPTGCIPPASVFFMIGWKK